MGIANRVAKKIEYSQFDLMTGEAAKCITRFQFAPLNYITQQTMTLALFALGFTEIKFNTGSMTVECIYEGKSVVFSLITLKAVT